MKVFQQLRHHLAKPIALATALVAAMALFSVVAIAQSAQVQGIIDARRGANMMVKS
jgi:hypothetical protein